VEPTWPKRVIEHGLIEGAGGIPPVWWPRWTKSRNLYYFWLCNRGKRKDVRQARWNINFSCQDDPTGGNRTGEVNKAAPTCWIFDRPGNIDLFVPGGFFGRRTGGREQVKKKLVNQPLGG